MGTVLPAESLFAGGRLVRRHRARSEGSGRDPEQTTVRSRRASDGRPNGLRSRSFITGTYEIQHAPLLGEHHEYGNFRILSVPPIVNLGTEPPACRVTARPET